MSSSCCCTGKLGPQLRKPRKDQSVDVSQMQANKNETQVVVKKKKSSK